MAKEVKDFLAYVKSSNLKDTAYFGIFQYGGGLDESFIKANYKGVLQFTHDLLEASLAIEENVEKPDLNQNNTKILNYDEEWIAEDGILFPQYLELMQSDRIHVQPPPNVATLSDKLASIGYFALTALLVACTITGFVTITRWVFQLKFN